MKKVKSFFKKLKEQIVKAFKEVKNFSKHNIFVITFILVSLIEEVMLRAFTVKNFSISPMLDDMALILLISATSYLFNQRKRYHYLMFWSIVFTLICVINSAYYTNYISFASFSLLETAKQVFGVKSSLKTIIEVKDFSYILGPIILILVNKYYRTTSYYDNVKTKKQGHITFLKMLVCALIFFGCFLSTITGVDLSRLYKQWNREYVVMKFGAYIYQTNDLIASLKPQISPLFGYDSAAKEVRDYYKQYPSERKTNEYTNIFKDKNVIVIHAESMQNYLLNTSINGVDVAPNLKRLASEGMYFSNFYAQESVGTSSDTEFTFNTSLLPASNGTVFVSYWDRQYIGIPKLLDDKGYYTFSMHANKGNFWNRDVMHKQLGYQKFYNYTNDFKINQSDIIGLGLNDKSFFKQASEKIKKIDEEHDKWYGITIMLTNHTPFEGLEDTMDLTYHYTKTNPDGTQETVDNNYLKGTTLGRYFTTAHYADEAIGQFVDELDSEGLLDNTVLVIYGDHDAKIKKSQYDFYYNYNPETDSKYEKTDPNYKEFTQFDYELNRKVPFIIWTKDPTLRKKINKEVKSVMGMYDVLPTLGNMLDFHSDYALGHDVFSTNENFVVFPNGNWVTDKMYYDSQLGEGLPLSGEAISKDYIEKYSDRSEKEVSVSNDIIVHDLIKKTKESEDAVKGE